jgi:hypothetical protein
MKGKRREGKGRICIPTPIAVPMLKGVRGTAISQVSSIEVEKELTCTDPPNAVSAASQSATDACSNSAMSRSCSH